MNIKLLLLLLINLFASVDGSSFGGGNDKKPIGGYIMAHSAQTRLSLRKGLKDNRIYKINYNIILLYTNY